MHTCKDCSETKSKDQFPKNSTYKLGHTNQCKSCRRVWLDEYNVRQRAFITSQKRKSSRKYRENMDHAERVAHKSVQYAREWSSLPTDELYGGCTYSEAVVFTIPFAEERLRLEAETSEPYNIDHIKALVNGGTHTEDNLQVLTQHDNMVKAASDKKLARKVSNGKQNERAS